MKWFFFLFVFAVLAANISAKVIQLNSTSGIDSSGLSCVSDDDCPGGICDCIEVDDDVYICSCLGTDKPTTEPTIE